MAKKNDPIEKKKPNSATKAKINVQRDKDRIYKKSAATKRVAQKAKPVEPSKPQARKEFEVNEKAETNQALQSANVEKIILKYTAFSVGAGTIPLPLFDALSVIAIQMKMVKELSAEHNIPYDENRAKSLILSVIGGVVSLEVSKGIIGLSSKVIPGAATLFGMSISTSVYGASTYAIGSVFAKHFQTGGTFLNYDLDKLKCSYKNIFNR